jgi:hypothetical protein
MLRDRYKREKFEPDRTQRDFIDVFSIQKSPPLFLPALKRQFWYRRPLSNIFSEALRLSGGHVCFETYVCVFLTLLSSG